MRRRMRIGLPALLMFGLVGTAAAQSTTYHLHNEASSTLGLLQLKTAGPDAAAVSVLSPNLKGQSPGSASMRTYDTQAGVPGVAGTIPSAATVTFTLWMRKTSSFGIVYPQAIAGLNWPGGTHLCTATGNTALSTTLMPYTITCITGAALTLTASDRFWVAAGYSMTQGPGNKAMQVELDYEGTLNGNYDSRANLPNPIPPTPAITGISPGAAPVNMSVTVSGTDFGTGGTLTFNGTAATPTNWAATSIQAPVPAGATSGPVVVTVNGIASNGYTFTVIPPPALTSLSASSGHVTDAITISGANFLASQGSSTVTFNGVAASPTVWTDTSITAPVPAGASTGPVVVTVSNQASNSLPFTVIPPPSLTSVTPTSGQVGTSVSIIGARFGQTQGSSTVSFNGTAGTPTSWTDTRVIVPVPAGATTGNVVVAVSNQASNGLPFTVLVAGTLGGTITHLTGGTPVSGAAIQALLQGVQKGSATSAGNGTYSITGLDPGTYDVRVTASGLSDELQSGVVVTTQSNTTLDVAMVAPGSVGGTVTESDGTTPIVGAAVTVFADGTQVGSANTNGSGAYSVGNLHPGPVTVQATSVGFEMAEQSASVPESAAATSNFALDEATAGPVTYAYDELGRLVPISRAQGGGIQ